MAASPAESQAEDFKLNQYHKSRHASCAFSYRKSCPPPHMLTGSVVCATMRKYHMRVYGPGRQEQTHDILADTDALARALAWRRYDKLIRELADQGAQPISALRAVTLHFSLSEGDRLVFESARKEDAG